MMRPKFEAKKFRRLSISSFLARRQDSEPVAVG